MPKNYQLRMITTRDDEKSTEETSADASGANNVEQQQPFRDLDILPFPGNTDWTTTLVLRCDPAGAPYTVDDVSSTLKPVVGSERPFGDYDVSGTFLNHVFTVEFHFNSMKRCLQRLRPLWLKGHRISVFQVCTGRQVTVTVKNIPMKINMFSVKRPLEKYGRVLLSDSCCRRDHKIVLELNQGVVPEDLPFYLRVDGWTAAVHVDEREPKCLECYDTGHSGPTCGFKGCFFYKEEENKVCKEQSIKKEEDNKVQGGGQQSRKRQSSDKEEETNKVPGSKMVCKEEIVRKEEGTNASV